MKSNIPIKETQNSLIPNFANITKNILLCYGFTFFCLLVFAFIITYTDFPESFIPAIVLLLTIASVILAGILVARKSSSKGWLSGAISGIVYMVTLYIIGSIVFHSFTFGMNVVAMLSLGLFSGTFGGIIGINMKYKK